MNLKRMMNGKVSDSRKIKDAQETNIVYFDSNDYVDGNSTENEKTLASKINSLAAYNQGKLSTLSWLMGEINELATKYGVDFRYEIASNKNLVKCVLGNVGWISFAIVKAPTKQLVDRLNAGQEI